MRAGGTRSLDLTEGSIVKKIIIFSIPLLLGQIFQNLYNSVDSIVVGNYVGVTALAAVTSCADISRLLVGFFTGLSVGAGVAFSRYFGAKKYDELHDCIHTALTFAAILGIVMMTLGILISPLLLKMVDCPDDVYPEALAYLRVYLVGILFTSIYNVESGVLRAVGDSRSPFIYLVIASLTNIVLDFLFVAVFKLGVIGVAIATINSQLESVLLVTIKMLRSADVYHLNFMDLRIRKPLLLEIIHLGIPAAIQSGLISFSNLFVQRSVNGFGTMAMAGAGAGKKIDSFVNFFSTTLGQACTTFVSQNVGANKYERAFKGIRVVILMTVLTVVITAIPVYIFADPVSRIFTQDNEAVYYAVMMIRTLMPVYFIQSFHQIYSNAVRGFGKSVVTMITSILGLIVMRQVYLAVAMSINHDIRLVFLGWPVGWICTFTMSFFYYIFAVKRPYRKAHLISKDADVD